MERAARAKDGKNPNKSGVAAAAAAAAAERKKMVDKHPCFTYSGSEFVV